jgi:hypothetical protein
MRRIYLERRRQRSFNFVEALQLYLRTVTRREDLRAVVLANVDGLVVAEAHADPLISPEEVASRCPLIVRVGGNCYDGKLDLPEDENLSLLLFLYRDQPLYLAAVGGKEDVCNVLLSALDGVQRILGS